MRRFLSILTFTAALISATAQNPVSMKDNYDFTVTGIKGLSGICLDMDSTGLFAVSDNGQIYRLAADGSKKLLTDLKEDAEGITLNRETGDLYVSAERSMNIWRIPAPGYNKPEIAVTMDYTGDPNMGPEGITWYKDDILIIGKQMAPAQLTMYSLSRGIIEQHNVSGMTEIADLCYVAQTDRLWIMDSNTGIAYECDLQGRPVASYKMSFDSGLNENPEALAVFPGGQPDMYIATELGARLYRITPEKRNSPTSASRGMVMVNEIDPGEKRIELYNPGKQDISLKGLRLMKNASTYLFTDKSRNRSIPAGGFAVIELKDDGIHGPEFGISAEKKWEVSIIDSDDKTIDACQKTDATGEIKYGYSLSRVPDGGADWKVQKQTIGKNNIK